MTTTAPYTPSQLSLQNFDAAQDAYASWVFSSPDSTAVPGSFWLQIYNNTNDQLVIDTGWVTSSLSQYRIPAYSLINRTQYRWRVQYKDTYGNASLWSQYQLFMCSSLPTVTFTSPTTSTVASNTLTLGISYQQAQNVQQQSYRLVLYASDQKTIVQDSSVQFNTANQMVCSGLANGLYYAQATVTSTDSLSWTTTMLPITVSYTGGSQSPSISTTPLPAQAAIRIDWHNPKSIPANYTGPGQNFQSAKFGSGLLLAAFGEKVSWLHQPVTQFTYTSWWLANEPSASMSSNQTIVYLQANSQNYVQVRYDPSLTAFIVDLAIGGQVITAKSATGLTFGLGQQVFIAVRQSSLLTVFVGLSDKVYTITVPPTVAPSVLGTATYGTAKYTSSVSGLVQNVKSTYVGCTPTDGNEINAVLDQTHLTTSVMSDADIQSLFLNATVQQFTTQTLFLANFENSLEGGDAGPVPIAYWNVNRTIGGVTKLLGVVQNSAQITATFTDIVPCSFANYQYAIVPIDALGNAGVAQYTTGSVVFDGWWLTDPVTKQTFQILYDVQDVTIKRNFQRAETQTTAQFPIVTYGPGRWRTGDIVGKLVGVNNVLSAKQQYDVLEAMIDQHRWLLLRGDEGWGIMADCFDLENTAPARNHRQYNVIKFSFTEVASA